MKHMRKAEDRLTPLCNQQGAEQSTITDRFWEVTCPHCLARMSYTCMLRLPQEGLAEHLCKIQGQMIEEGVE